MSEIHKVEHLLPIATMKLHVLLQVRQMTELFVANITAEFFLSRVPPHMSFQIGFLIVARTAHITSILFHSLSFYRFMVFRVTLKIARNILKANRTLLTNVAPVLPAMDFGVSLQVGLSTEGFLAQIAFKWMVRAMCSHMFASG